MYEAKTKPTGASVAAYLDAIEDAARREDCRELAAIMARATGCAEKPAAVNERKLTRMKSRRRMIYFSPITLVKRYTSGFDRVLCSSIRTNSRSPSTKRNSW